MAYLLSVVCTVTESKWLLFSCRDNPIPKYYYFEQRCRIVFLHSRTCSSVTQSFWLHIDLNSCTPCWNNTAVTFNLNFVPNRNTSSSAGSRLWSTGVVECWRSDRPHSPLKSAPECSPSAELICGCCCRTWGMTASFRSHAGPCKPSHCERRIFFWKGNHHTPYFLILSGFRIYLWNSFAELLLQWIEFRAYPFSLLL